jgi:hypothetical protein
LKHQTELSFASRTFRVLIGLCRVRPLPGLPTAPRRVGPRRSPSSGRRRSCACTTPGSAANGTGCPGAGSAPAVPSCLGRSERSSVGWPPRTPGVRPASTGNHFASASTSPSGASRDTCAPCLARRGPTPPGGRPCNLNPDCRPRPAEFRRHGRQQPRIGSKRKRMPMAGDSPEPGRGLREAPYRPSCASAARIGAPEMLMSPW